MKYDQINIAHQWNSSYKVFCQQIRVFFSKNILFFFFRNVMTVPVIDGIDHKTFEYRPVYQEGHLYRGIFEWGMLYKENELPRREAKARAHDSMPYRYNFYFKSFIYNFIIVVQCFSSSFISFMRLTDHLHTLVAYSR